MLLKFTSYLDKLWQVSRLLTVLHVLSTSVTAFSLSSETALSDSHWAAFFHQASIGNNVNQLLFSCLMQKGKEKDTRDNQVHVIGLLSIGVNRLQ